MGAKDKKEPSKMMKQYLSIKSEYQDCILFFRLGDFYEMFYDDAITASQLLEITLTGKDCGQEERAPMCGVPYHSAQNYIARLIKHGKKVAICEQVEDPKTSRDIVKRDVVRIITPGTANLDSMLTPDENNYLACIFIDDDYYGLTLCDVTTGEFITTDGPNDRVENQLVNTLACFRPKEIIINDRGYKKTNAVEELKNRYDFYESFVCEEYFEIQSAQELTREKFANQWSEGFFFDKDYCVRSAGAILRYLDETQKTDLSHIQNISYYKSCDYLDIDMSSRRNLELTETMRDKSKKGSLYGILDKTGTGMGARMLKSWIDRPLVNCDAIEERLSSVEELCNNRDLLDSLRTELRKIKDVERIISKTVFGSCNARDFFALKESISQLPSIKRLLRLCKSPLFVRFSKDFDDLSDIFILLESALKDDELPLTIREGGFIKDGFDKELDRLRGIMNNGAGVVAQMEAMEKEKTGIKTLKINYNKVYGYYIDVTKSFLSQVPDHYIRKQTLTGSERFITPELKDLENTILSAKERVNELEYADFMYLRDNITKNIKRFKKMAETVSVTDVLCSLSYVASVNGYVKPTVNDSGVIDIKDGRHPIVELSASGGLFVPNNTYLDKGENRFSIITGPNMAGKSTYMRQIAIITLMAQMGSFVPAKSASIGIVDRIFTRIGASDDLSSGQSTFMVEMNEVAHILREATDRSLLILDEIGRGTSTYDGLSIAWAVVEYTANKIGAKALFATHYHELTELEERIEGVRNYSVAVKRRGDDITFLRKIVRGGTDDSFGIEVAKLAGVPDEVTDRAKEVLHAIESKEGKSDISIEKTLRNTELQKATASKLYDEIMSIDISTLTPLEAMNELFELQKKVGKLSEN